MPRNLNVTVRSWIPSQGGGGLRSLPLDTQLLPFHTPPLSGPSLSPSARTPLSPSISSYPVDQVIGGKDQGGGIPPIILLRSVLHSNEFYDRFSGKKAKMLRVRDRYLSENNANEMCQCDELRWDSCHCNKKLKLKGEAGEIFVSHCKNLKYLYLFLELSEIRMFSWTFFQFFERVPNTFFTFAFTIVVIFWQYLK
jgi:hypothetical protein